MLYMIGCILFTDKSGYRVGTHYLLLLDYIDYACGVAWGISVIAFLYRQLGLTTRYKVKQFDGFIPLSIYLSIYLYIYIYIYIYNRSVERDYMEQVSYTCFVA
ncbi:hypothetical protein ACS0TY_003391 [Phlomoides rotata]